ncbi:MAG TPA: GNAT family N-acetyltransferase [Flavobacterium sp.]|nr:GNAT family N-acetyltransferase [Flavobacterium sp.]
MKPDFDFSQDLILENDIVLLRPLELSDFENLVEFSVNEPEIWKYSLIPADSPDNIKRYIEAALEGRKEKKQYPFIVYDKTKKRHAGCTRFYQIDFANESLHIGYTWYGKDFQGTGLNKNCKLLLLDYAFENMGIFRVEFRADNNNEKSVAAMKSIGCTAEGVLRKENLLYTGYRRDTIILSMLKEEWLEALRKKLEDKINSK